MLSGLTLRYKILVSYMIIFVMFMIFMYLFASQLVEEIVVNSMYVQVNDLIKRLQKAPNDLGLIDTMQDQKYLIFFRVAVINDQQQLIYDSYGKRLQETGRESPKILKYPEVEQAIKTGVGINERISKTIRRNFIYLAKTFDFHGKTYIIRTAFPTKFTDDLAQDIKIGLMGFSTSILLLFGFVSWFVVNRLTRPVEQIINAIRPYQNRETASIPELKISGAGPNDEFSKLAQTLNSLSARIQSQIQTVTEERNEKAAVFESLVEGVVAVDENLVVTDVNSMALNFLNCSKEQLLGRSFSETGQYKCIEMLKACQKEQRVLHDTLQIRKQEGSLYLDVTAAPKQEKGAILVLEDKSEHYKLLDMRRDFIANASHELKTPITIINGFAETLHDNDNLPVDMSKTITEKIMRNCQRMTNIIKDLLALTDLEGIQESRLLECDMEELVEKCCQVIQDLFPAAKIIIHKQTDSDYTLMGDPYLLEMGLMNLLENAGKYSLPPAEITVDLSKKDQWIEISVSDKGIGIPEQDVEHIFERFYTVNKAHSRKLGGSGLGLSIVHMIAEKHFGTASVKSIYGSGSTFTLRIPASRKLE